MATKEDILEQVVEEYLIHKGYFVQHNIKFRPRESHPDYVKAKDSSNSDIDVVGYNPNINGACKVMAVSCKSWQGGFNPNYLVNWLEKDKNKKLHGREVWKGFRELVEDKWAESFRMKILEATGEKEFTYVTAVTRLKGDREIWENYQPFREALDGNPVIVLTFPEMVSVIEENLTKTLAATEVGRLLQLFKAAGIKHRNL